MSKSYVPQLVLIFAIATGVNACGNNTDETESSGTDSSPVMVNNDMGMTGMGAGSMANMPGMAEQVQTDSLVNSRMTDQGNFRISIKSELDPIPINTLQSWMLSLENSRGEPVDNAVITVAGGMPAHNHGMPTAPQVTSLPGNGQYLIEGVQFQMPGHWVIKLNISANDVEDTATYNLMLQP